MLWHLAILYRLHYKWKVLCFSSRNLKLLVFQESACIYLSTNIQAVHVGCKLSIYQIHTGNPGLERASRGLGGLLVCNLADFWVSGFQKGFFVNCKTQGFRTRQGIDERTMK